MLGVKRLYWFVFKSFLPLFLMTFFICLFIVLMQFLWRYIDDLVGKGLTMDVLGELFFYAALTMIPMALPLAILLASLMIFGNLGEHFELTAMKASGISLIKVMRPLIILMVLIAIGAFFFQNNVLPIAQTKMWTLLFSVRQKSPELEIPEGVFYDQIPGYNLYVQKKDRESGTLHDVMIYDMSRGFDNARVILADSAHLASTSDNRRLFLQLWNGEMFENLNEAGAQRNIRNVPYRRESFTEKEILMTFDANFNKIDEGGIRNQYVGKNIAELRHSIDSINMRVDSLGDVYARDLTNQTLMGVTPVGSVISENGLSQRVSRLPDVSKAATMDIDSVFRGPGSSSTATYLTIALNKAKRNKQEYEFKSYSMTDDRKIIRRHEIELQKKFTLSFACIIFFFIGAPLGAIIRKGGLGTPLVISVLLFIFYYIIDNTGYKMAREGRIDVVVGMWLSSAVLLPMGIFFTYKAVNDSAVFNRDAYINFFRRMIGSHETRNLEMKEVIMEEVDVERAEQSLMDLKVEAEEYLKGSRMSYLSYWLSGLQPSRLDRLSRNLEEVVEHLSNSRSKLVVNKLMDYPVIRNLWIYHPARVKWLSYTMIALFPISIVIYFIARRYNKYLCLEVKKISKVSTELVEILNEEEEKKSHITTIKQ